jgi:Putative zinc-finger
VTDDRDLNQLLGRLAEDGRGRPDPAEHPSDGTLSFYHARKLSPEEEDRVRNHLVECKRCRDLLLEYAEFMEDDEEEEQPAGVADFGAAADWQRLRGVVTAAEETKRVDRAYETGTPRSFFRSLKTAYSIAAVLALAVVGLSIYVANLGRQEATPEASVSEISLRSDNRAELEQVVLPPGEDRKIPFSLSAPDSKPYPRYVLKAFDAADREVRSWEDLEADEAEEFHFTLDSRVFAPGINTLRILGIDGEKTVLIGEYQFNLVRRIQ